jgi:hypothetical protein
MLWSAMTAATAEASEQLTKWRADDVAHTQAARGVHDGDRQASVSSLQATGRVGSE